MRVQRSDYSGRGGSRMSRSPRVCRRARTPARASSRDARHTMPRALLTALALAALTSALGVDTCSRDGLHADYDTDCREYYRCLNGATSARYVCGHGRAFSEAEGACVLRRRQPCVRRACGLDTRAYAAPGTACRHYYRCENGTSQELACPSGAWFDWARQACTRGAGTCFEPLCAGLPDGDYPDASHECQRTLRCRGGELNAVTSCGRLCSGAAACPPPRAAAVPIPAGSADFCSDEACSSLCREAEDGPHADRSTGCREYYVCESRRVTRRGVCDQGLLFSEGRCRAARRASCPAPARSPCFDRPDGLHRDWRDCGSWFECRRERVAARGACPAGLLFDGAGCVPPERFFCEGPRRAAECEGRPSGMYQDLPTNCTHYYHCEGPLRTLLSCAAGHVWDGARCSPVEEGYVCPSLEVDSCVGRPDGRYRAPGAGCRGYIACAAEERTNYACAPGQVFDGDACVRATPAACVEEDVSCVGRSDGYHADLDTKCRRYFYCEGGDRLATLSCHGGKIFDGRTCADATRHRCGEPTTFLTSQSCQRDGFFLHPGTACERYYFCVTGVKTSLKCPTGQVFNGQVCVPKSQYTCPG